MDIKGYHLKVLLVFAFLYFFHINIWCPQWPLRTPVSGHTDYSLQERLHLWLYRGRIPSGCSWQWWGWQWRTNPRNRGTPWIEDSPWIWPKLIETAADRESSAPIIPLPLLWQGSDLHHSLKSSYHDTCLLSFMCNRKWPLLNSSVQLITSWWQLLRKSDLYVNCLIWNIYIHEFNTFRHY